MRSLGWLVVATVMSGCGSSDPSLIPAPPAGQGFQLAVAPFDVPVGVDTQRCYFFNLPGTPDQEIWVNKYEVGQPVGSHHMNLFSVKTIKNLAPTPDGSPVIDGECFNSANWSDWPLIVNSQVPANTEWELPTGVGAKFHGGDLVMVQTHFVNANTQKTPTGNAHVRVNFWTTTAQPNELGTIFATNQNIEVCPGDVGRSFTKTCMFPASANTIHIVGANGHFHSRGVEFDMYASDAMGNQGAQFYQSMVWDEPPMVHTQSADQMSIADIAAGGGVQWKCVFDFPTTPGACGADKTGMPTPNCCYEFGPRVDINEHCNAFVYYWPKVDTSLNCF